MRERSGCGLISGTRGISLKELKQITEGLRPR